MGSPSILSSPIFNMGFLIVGMQMAKKFDFEDPQTLTYLRICYYAAQVLTILLAYGLIALIKKKNDTTPLKYEEAAKPSLTGAQPAGPKEVVTTNMQYDIDQVKQLIQSTATSVLMISVMHWQFKFIQPLFMQSIMPIKNLLAHKEALIHIWGDKPEGNLQRPFKAENPLSAFLGGGAGATDSSDDHKKKE